MSRNISSKELRLLYTQSGNVCAFPGCNEPLTEPPAGQDEGVNTSDVCHVIADSRQGPRGHSDLSDEDRQKHTNLILFCLKHHRTVDTQPRTYSVPVLQQMKRDHEERVQKLRAESRPPTHELVKEKVHSTVMAVTHVPATVYSAPCKITDDPRRVAEQIVYPKDRGSLTPFILRDGKLYTFVDIEREANPFCNVVNWRQAGRQATEEFWSGDEGGRRFANLLNQTISRHLRGLGIGYDKDHKRYYFGLEVEGEPRTFKYRPLNTGERDADVVFPAENKAGEFKGYWWHKAVGLRFERVGPRALYLSIRPERHVTLDGLKPLPPEKVGRRVTRLKARMYNDKYMAEVQFWRDVLCGGKPRLIARAGHQSLIVDSQLLTFDMEWPGVPDDEKSFKNQTYQDDLFTLADLYSALEGRPLVDEEDELDDDEAE